MWQIKGLLQVGRRKMGYKKDVFSKQNKGSSQSKSINYNSMLSKKIREKVNEAGENLKKNTPRVVGALMILTGMPQMYFYYQMLTREYDDPLYIDSIKKYVDAQNIKNAFYGGLALGLLVTKYTDYKVKHTSLMKLHRPMEFIVLVPVGLALFTLSYQNYARSYSVYGTLIADGSLMFLESLLVNAAILPFW